jgi:MFS family permease
MRRLDSPSFSVWRSLGISVLLPTALAYASKGAAVVVVTISALHLGASESTAALIGALGGVGSLVGSIPAGRAVTRYGDRNVLFVSLAAAAVIWVTAMAARSVAPLGVAAVLGGFCASGFGIARQSYTIELTPPSHRGRAMSALGGAGRVGLVLGPVIVGLAQPSANPAVGFVSCAALAAAAAATVLANVAPGRRSGGGKAGGAKADGSAAPTSTIRRVATDHARTLASVGLGVVLLAGARALRSIVIPLAAIRAGYAPGPAAILVGTTAAVEVALFYPAGIAMDQLGRRWVAGTCLTTMAVALLVQAVAAGRVGVVLGGLLLAAGSGLGAGIIKTLGADLAPQPDRATFLGLWNVISEAGSTVGPLAVGGLLAVTSFGTALCAVGMACLLGAVWLDRAIKTRQQAGHILT